MALCLCTLSEQIVSIALSSGEKLLDSAIAVAEKIILEKGVSSFVGIWVGVYFHLEILNSYNYISHGPDWANFSNDF